MITVTIEKIDNGYLLKTQHGFRVLYADGAQTLFTQLLRELEDRHPDREGASYGKVTVEYQKPMIVAIEGLPPSSQP